MGNLWWLSWLATAITLTLAVVALRNSKRAHDTVRDLTRRAFRVSIHDAGGQPILGGHPDGSDKSWLWLGALSGFTISPITAGGNQLRLSVAHRCGWEHVVTSYTGSEYVANLIDGPIVTHRAEGCRRGAKNG